MQLQCLLSWAAAPGSHINAFAGVTALRACVWFDVKRSVVAATGLNTNAHEYLKMTLGDGSHFREVLIMLQQNLCRL